MRARRTLSRNDGRVLSTEDDVTRALVRLVADLGDDERLEFLREALGVTAVARDGAVSAESHPASPYESQSERIVMIGLAPSDRIDWRDDGDTSPGSIIDAVFSQFARLIVLLEVKVRGRLDGWQLARHAGAWDMPVLPIPWDELPRGVGVVPWSHVVRWLDSRPATPATTAFRAQLEAAGLEQESAMEPPARTPAVPRGEEPVAADLTAVLESVAAADVRAAVTRLYGSNGPFHVSGDAASTKRDARSAAKRFEQADETIPGRLLDTGPGGEGDVITPARALSMLASARPLARRHLIAPTWADVRDRLVFRGADRGVAVAMWAFADALSGPDQRRLHAHAGRVWNVAPPRSHATPELTEALAELQVPLG
ncbi:MAG: hypothetical protein QOJ29_5013 [Thermoleophilaceae bacterium]|nr:hypothetical protein [Thermoleophilaceae bacterium]